jgi:hypothetical protein
LSKTEIRLYWLINGKGPIKTKVTKLSLPPEIAPVSPSVTSLLHPDDIETATAKIYRPNEHRDSFYFLLMFIASISETSIKCNRKVKNYVYIHVERTGLLVLNYFILPYYIKPWFM